MRVEGEDGCAVELTLSPAMEVWTAPAAREDASQGFVIVPILRAEGQASANLSVQLIPGPQYLQHTAPEYEEEDVDEEETEEDGTEEGEVDEDQSEHEDQGEDEDQTLVPGD